MMWEKLYGGSDFSQTEGKHKHDKGQKGSMKIDGKGKGYKYPTLTNDPDTHSTAK